MAPEKVFLEVARELLETGAARIATEGASHGAPALSGEFFLTLLPIFEHGLQFRFNEITYFLEH